MYKPPRAYIWRGDLTEGLLRHDFGGLYLDGLIFGILRYFTLPHIIEYLFTRSLEI